MNTATKTSRTVPVAGWTGVLQDLPREHGFEPLRVDGQLPADLRGTLYRNGPALFSTGGEPYRHWFDGDGAVSAVELDGQVARGAVRVVQSRGLLRERAAGRAIYGGFGTRSSSLIGRLKGEIKNAANTNVMSWQGRVLALFEGGGPTELSDALRTVGETDLGGVVQGPFSAHPHYVAARRTTYNFGVRYGRKTLLDIYALPDQGAARQLTTIELAGPTMVHDFIATDRHLVFFAPPLRLRVFRMLLGFGSFNDNLVWRPELGTEVIVVPIDDPTRVVRFDVDPFYQWHFANAYDEGDAVVVDVVRYTSYGPNLTLDRLRAGAVVDAGNGGTLHRATIRPATRGFELRQLWGEVTEFPRVAPQVEGAAHRYVYSAARGTDSAFWDSLVKLDVTTGEARHVPLEPGHYASEPVFVPRASAAGEDDGYVLSLVYDASAHRSYLAVADARRPEDGPIARAWFDQHIPYTFHGNWAPR